MDSTLFNVLVTASVAALLFLVALLARWLAAQTKSEWLAAAVTRAKELMLSVVHEVQVGLRQKQASASADGVITAAEAEELRKEALRLFREALTARGIEMLKRQLGIPDEKGLETYLYGLVERTVEVKKTAAASLDASRATVEVATRPRMPPVPSKR